MELNYFVNDISICSSLSRVCRMSGSGVCGAGKMGGFSTPAPVTQRDQKYLGRPDTYRKNHVKLEYSLFISIDIDFQYSNFLSSLFTPRMEALI